MGRMEKSFTERLAIILMVVSIALSFLKGMPLSFEMYVQMDSNQGYGIINFLGLNIRTTVEVTQFLSQNLYTLGEIGVALFFIGMAGLLFLMDTAAKRAKYVRYGLIISSAGAVIITDLIFRLHSDMPFGEADLLQFVNWAGFFGCAVGTMMACKALARGDRKAWWPTIPAVALIASYLIIVVLYELISASIPISYYAFFWSGEMVLFVGLATSWRWLQKKEFAQSRPAKMLYLVVLLALATWCVLLFPVILLASPPWHFDNFEMISLQIFLEMLITCGAFGLSLYLMIKGRQDRSEATSIGVPGTGEGAS